MCSGNVLANVRFSCLYIMPGWNILINDGCNCVYSVCRRNIFVDDGCNGRVCVYVVSRWFNISCWVESMYILFSWFCTCERSMYIVFRRNVCRDWLVHVYIVCRGNVLQCGRCDEFVHVYVMCRGNVL